MATGRTVMKVTTYSNSPFNHTKTDVLYSDGTTETFGPLSGGYIPSNGDVEDIGSYGNRVGFVLITLIVMILVLAVMLEAGAVVGEVIYNLYFLCQVTQLML